MTLSPSTKVTYRWGRTLSLWQGGAGDCERACAPPRAAGAFSPSLLPSASSFFCRVRSVHVLVGALTTLPFCVATGRPRSWQRRCGLGKRGCSGTWIQLAGKTRMDDSEPALWSLWGSSEGSNAVGLRPASRGKEAPKFTVRVLSCHFQLFHHSTRCCAICVHTKCFQFLRCRRHKELESALSAAAERGEAVGARAERLQAELHVSV